MTVHPSLMPAEPVVSPAKSIPPLAVGLQDAARLLGISDTHFEKHVAAGEIPVIRIGARRLFRVKTLDRFLRQRERTESKPGYGHKPVDSEKSIPNDSASS